jgi:hypothetical protein
VTDTRPPLEDGGEKATLTAFLGYLREAIIAKATGIPDAHARRPGVDSGTSLLWLVKHSTVSEWYWFAEMYAGEDTGRVDFGAEVGPDDSTADLVAAYREAIRHADGIIAAAADLNGRCARSRAGREPRSLRWVLVHMIEETARHAGHADILREQLDGATGR